jgi:hypothetical protein
MTESDGASSDIHPIARYISPHLDVWIARPPITPHLHVTEHLSGEGLVDLEEIDITKPKVEPSQQSRQS